MATLRLKNNNKFDGRVWLTTDEWQTYRRTPPVRYVGSALPTTDTCSLCGQPFSITNPLTVAHRVPFSSGVIDWGLTPEWLNQAENLRATHRAVCNKHAELSDDEIALYLYDIGLDYRDSAPYKTGALLIEDGPLVPIVRFYPEVLV